VVTAAASGITTTEAEQQRMEERLAALGAEKVRELAAFTLQYIARYAAAGKVRMRMCFHVHVLRCHELH
jgi:hypothetical protein